jgi:hypothetical protein
MSTEDTRTTAVAGPGVEQGVMALAPKRERGPVEIYDVFRGAYIQWGQKGCGFGQLAFGPDKGGRLTCDSECMGREWVRQALHALADHVADNAHFSDFPECSGDESSCPENEGRGCCGGKRHNVRGNGPDTAAQEQR